MSFKFQDLSEQIQTLDDLILNLEYLLHEEDIKTMKQALGWAKSEKDKAETEMLNLRIAAV